MCIKQKAADAKFSAFIAVKPERFVKGSVAQDIKSHFFGFRSSLIIVIVDAAKINIFFSLTVKHLKT